MLGKIALLTVALMLLGATVAFAGGRTAELDNNPSPSEQELSETAVPVYTSTSVWRGTIADDERRVPVYVSTSVWPGTIADDDGRDYLREF